MEENNCQNNNDDAQVFITQHEQTEKSVLRKKMLIQIFRPYCFH